MRFDSKLLLLTLLLAGCSELQGEFQGPSRLEVVGAKEGACITAKVAGQSTTKCGESTFRFSGLSGKVSVQVQAVWRGLEVQGYQGEVELHPGKTVRVELARKTLSLQVEAPWASPQAVYEAWVPAEWAFGVTVYPGSAPAGLEGTRLVAKGDRLLRVPTAPYAWVRVRDGNAEARARMDSLSDGIRVLVEAPTYAPIRLTPEGVASRVECVVAYMGQVEGARSCTAPFSLSLTPPDGSYREVVLVGLADGLPFQEGRVSAKSGDDRTVPLERKRVRVELTAPRFTADVEAYGEVWLRPEDQEGVALYGDPSPTGYAGYRLADRAVVVNGVATLSVPTGRFVLFRMVGGRTTEGVVDRVDRDGRVVLP